MENPKLPDPMEYENYWDYNKDIHNYLCEVKRETNTSLRDSIIIPNWYSPRRRKVHESKTVASLMPPGTLFEIEAEQFPSLSKLHMVKTITVHTVCLCYTPGSFYWTNSASGCEWKHLHSANDEFDVWTVEFVDENAKVLTTDTKVDGWINDMIVDETGRITKLFPSQFQRDITLVIRGMAKIARQEGMFK